MVLRPGRVIVALESLKAIVGVLVFCKHLEVTRFEPFRGWRYNLAEFVDISPVIAPPYDVLSNAQRDALKNRHRANSVRLDYPDGKSDPGAYTAARAELDAWIADNTLLLDQTPTLTVYRMTDLHTGRRTTGVIGALGLEHPGVGDVLPHEETTSKDKADRLSLIRSTEINTSPIWVLSTAKGLGLLCARIADAAAATASGVDEANVRHECWVVSDPTALAEIAANVQSAPVVVADGHHRLETALTYETQRPEANAIMSFVVELSPEELEVRPIHRLVSAESTAQVESALARFFDIVDVVDVVDVGTDVVASPDGPVLLRSDATRAILRPRSGAFDDTVDLDSQRVRIALSDVSSATTAFHHDIDTVRAAVASGEAQAGILLRPATVTQIRRVADTRTRMPPKSTFFYPKPRTGIVFRPVVDPT